MKFIADLHIHSPYSRATSPGMTAEGLTRWAQLKGIRVLGTGDFTHPAWIAELKEKLEPGPEGLYALRERHRAAANADNVIVPASCRQDPFFLLQAEVSSIFKKHGRTRKVHSIILAPGLEEAGEIGRRLGELGNVRSDGRPILGLEAKRILEIALDVSPDSMVIPAHAWTPHFSVFGSASGFDSLEECYEELTPHIHALETGLSSDPPMNRRLSALDRLTLISNSDAHSPSKLGREANVFDTELTYPAIIRAIKTRLGFEGTMEFFPEEGKYHLDGHRKCGVRLHPGETKRLGGRCPVCGRALTVGVMHRVEDLADREEPRAERFTYLIPLEEIVAECLGRGVGTKGVRELYFRLLAELGNELHVLMEAGLADIKRTGGERIAEAVGRMRRGEISIEPGFDGEYGKVGIF